MNGFARKLSESGERIDAEASRAPRIKLMHMGP
jgi:hypothetical protein